VSLSSNAGALRDKFLKSDATFLTGFALVIGAIAGLSSVGFRALIRFFNAVVAAPLVGLSQRLLGSPLAGTFAGPAIGGLLVGLIAVFVFHKRRQTGVTDTIEILALQQRTFRFRDFLSMLFLSSLTIGSGGSAGQEGPMVVLGASAGTLLGKRFRPSPERLRALAGCGIAGAIAAAFNAPLAGVFFAIEVVIGDWTLPSFAPTVLASVVATAVSRAAGYNVPTFQIRPYAVEHAWEIALYALLGLLVGVIGFLYQRAFFAVEEFFERSSFKPWMTPAIGGCAVGAIGVFFPQVYGNGYETVTAALDGQLAVWVLLALVVAKTIATALTLGSRGWGGDLAPSLFVGAMLGGAVGLMGHQLFASAGEGNYALVGMAAFLSAVIHAPLTSILLAFEVTDNYRIILPVMTAVVTATLIARAFGADSIYREKLRKRGVKLQGQREDPLWKSLTVAAAMQKPEAPIPAHTPYREVIAALGRSRKPLAVVTGPDGRLRGVLYFEDLREYLTSPDVSDVVVAEDLLEETFPVLRPTDSLGDALTLFGRTDREAVVVVSPEDERKVVGVLSRRNVLDAYQRSRRASEAVTGGELFR
jgi:CIC family chloride channel protein